jgi:hypothetical protein
MHQPSTYPDYVWLSRVSSLWWGDGNEESRDHSVEEKAWRVAVFLQAMQKGCFHPPTSFQLIMWMSLVHSMCCRSLQSNVKLQSRFTLSIVLHHIRSYDAEESWEQYTVSRRGTPDEGSYVQMSTMFFQVTERQWSKAWGTEVMFFFISFEALTHFSIMLFMFL